MIRSMSFALLFALGLAAVPASAADTWVVDESHTNVDFSVRHMMITNVRGAFTTFEGVLEYDPKKVTKTKIQGTIDVASVDTDDAKRDEHLRSADFFDVATHPKMTFESTKVVKDGDGYVAVGNLTLRGVTKEIRMPVEFSGPIKDPWGNDRIGFSASTTIDRQEFGVKWNKTLDAGGAVVGDKVRISIEGEAVKQAAK
jgi:polyisoprenoid-binding protein YceI